MKQKRSSRLALSCVVVLVVAFAPIATTVQVAAGTPIDDTQTITIDDHVDLWERAPLSMRTSSDGATTVRGPETFINVKSASTGDIPLNRQDYKVFNRSEPINFTYETGVGVDTEVTAGDDVQLLAVRLADGTNVSGYDNETQIRELVDLFDENQNVLSAEVLDDAKGVGSVGPDGELTVSYTPEKGGTYVFVLATLDEPGDGFTVEDDVISAESNVTVVGLEQAFVQEGQSSVHTDSRNYNPGDDVEFTVEADVNDTDVAHAIVLYRQNELVRERVSIIIEGPVSPELSADQVTVENSIDQVFGHSSVDDDTRIARINFNNKRAFPPVAFPGLFDYILRNASTQTPAESATVLHGAGVAVQDDETVTLTVPTEESWRLGSYRYVHFAVGNESALLRTDTGRITLSRAGGNRGGGNQGDERGNSAGNPNRAGSTVPSMTVIETGVVAGSGTITR